MVITPFDLDKKNEDQDVPLSLDSRRSAGKKQIKLKTAVVDVREFRSTLPSLLHSDGIELLPATIQVMEGIIHYMFYFGNEVSPLVLFVY